MMVNIDPAKDIAELLAAAQPQPNRGLHFGQGTILSWNLDTFESEIDFRGVTLRNPGVLSGPDALTYKVGDVVALQGWAPNGGFSSWWIIGRVITPGSGAGAAAIDWMTSALGAQIAAAVFGNRIQFDTVVDNEATSSTSYTNLTTVGPTVPDVEVSSTGRALVMLYARLSGQKGGSNISTPHMSYEISGATSTSPSDLRALQVPSETDGAVHAVTAVFLHSTLNEGLNTFQAKYKMGGGQTEARFTQRTLIVIPF
jgi:hypothetical protein